MVAQKLAVVLALEPVQRVPVQSYCGGAIAQHSTGWDCCKDRLEQRPSRTIASHPETVVPLLVGRESLSVAWDFAQVMQ